MQQVALGLAAKWYSTEVNRTGEVNSPEFTDEYVKNITDTLNADMKVANGKLNACLVRARANPASSPLLGRMAGRAASSRPVRVEDRRLIAHSRGSARRW